MAKITREIFRGLLEELAAVHYEESGHVAFSQCQCGYALILRKMSALLNEGPRKKKTRTNSEAA
jgi:hypothetical protein